MKLKLGVLLFILIFIIEIIFIFLGYNSTHSFFNVLQYIVTFWIYISYHSFIKNLGILHISILGSLLLLIFDSLLIKYSPENSGGSVMFSFLLLILAQIIITVGLSYEKKEEGIQGYVQKQPTILIPYGIFATISIVVTIFYIKNSAEELLGSSLLLSSIILNLSALNRMKKVKSNSFDMVFFGSLLLFISHILYIIQSFYDSEFNGSFISQSSKKFAFFIIAIGILIANKDRNKKKFKARPFIRSKSSTSPHLPD